MQEKAFNDSILLLTTPPDLPLNLPCAKKLERFNEANTSSILQAFAVEITATT
jgi:hypothetical protein